MSNPNDPAPPTPDPAPADPTPADQTPTPEAPAQETDWKAEARKWEARAKKASGAEERLAELEKASMTELERAKAEAAEARAEADKFRQREQLAEWKAQVSEETGVPAAALAGSTLEDLQAHAAVLKPLISKEPEPPAPYIVPTEGAQPGKGPASQLTEADIDQMSPEEINAARKAGRLNKLLGIS